MNNTLIWIILMKVCIMQLPSVTSQINLLDKYLFTNYSKHQVPRKNSSETLELYFTQTYVALQRLDERAGTIEIALKTVLLWTDDYLVWNPQNFSGVNNSVCRASEIWTPDIGRHFILFLSFCL